MDGGMEEGVVMMMMIVLAWVGFDVIVDGWVCMYVCEGYDVQHYVGVV